MKRKICIITGSRAEYGLLVPLIQEIRDDSNLTCQLIVTGMHLSSEFGSTGKEIEKDGFRIDEKVDISLDSDTSIGISRSMAFAMTGFARAYERLKPHVIVVLGDRFEIFSAVSAALVSRICVAHIGGGDITEGSFDDTFRHSITKMSHLHFTATKESRKRVIQLGESPGRVFNVGALGIDNIKKSRLLARRPLEKELGFEFNKKNLLVSFHPVTLEKGASKRQFQILLDTLDGLKEDTNLIFTKTNADPEGRMINSLIDNYVAKNTHRAVSFISMGRIKFLSTLRFVDGIVGNSSSGIVEAPSFRIGAVNIGDRQKGRIKAEKTIDCQPERASIKKAINILYSEAFKKKLKSTVNPHGDGNAAKKIKHVLKNYDIRDILKKSFYDISFRR